jgi:hypothetical protein
LSSPFIVRRAEPCTNWNIYRVSGEQLLRDNHKNTLCVCLNFGNFVYHICPVMNRLENKLDNEVNEYLSRVEGMKEVRALLSGEVSKGDYVRFLKTFFAIEHLSRRAVLKAADNTENTNPYLSARFRICAKGELGHAEIALKDLSGMGVEGVDIADIPFADEYDDLLMNEADSFPLGILGHSYLFENASGIMFPKHKQLPYPSKFIEVHAKEDPGHSLAIKRTVRAIQPDVTSEQQKEILGFARKSGDLLLKLFNGIKA